MYIKWKKKSSRVNLWIHEYKFQCSCYIINYTFKTSLLSVHKNKKGFSVDTPLCLFHHQPKKKETELIYEIHILMYKICVNHLHFETLFSCHFLIYLIQAVMCNLITLHTEYLNSGQVKKFWQKAVFRTLMSVLLFFSAEAHETLSVQQGARINTPWWPF